MKKRILNVIGIILAILLVIGIYVFLSSHIKYDCPIKKIFGIYCAGCGGTRMLKSLLAFQFYKAFRYNSIIFILIIISVPIVIYKIIIYIKKGTIRAPSLKFYLIVITILALFMILRNIPGFDYLKPTSI